MSFPPQFRRYIGVDCSGAKTPTSSLKGLRVHTPERRTADQHDAYCVAAWLQEADRDGKLARSFNPELPPADRRAAQVEGWILGVG